MFHTATQTTIAATDGPRRAVENSLSVPTTTYRTVSVDGLKVFYREAGNPQSPAVLLLHGFPTSSHMYRELIPALADRYRVVAPDLPGFGFSEAPDRKTFKYTFDHLAEVIDRFTEVLGLGRYALYVFDYGAPVGFRLAVRHPERITALISQNGNAYEEGLSDGWNPIQAYWKDPSPENRSALRAFLTPGTTQWQYTHGATNPERLSPDTWTLDSALLARPGNDEIQLDLFGDYQSNVKLYPKFQDYFRTRRPPLLAVWGKNDPFFLPAGAEAFKRDNPEAEIHLLDAGHFALESRGSEIAAIIRDFLAREKVRPLRPERGASMAMSQTMDKMDNKLVTPAEIQWGPGPAVLPAGIQGAVLYGDPTKDGLFSMRFKLPKGYRVPPHTLSKAGLFTVMSGTFRIGMGEKADPSKAKAMPAGSFVALAPGIPHFVAVDEETVVQLNNIGPWVITYIDPKDDPRQESK